jgi:hypothetical protein
MTAKDLLSYSQQLTIQPCLSQMDAVHILTSNEIQTQAHKHTITNKQTNKQQRSKEIHKQTTNIQRNIQTLTLLSQAHKLTNNHLKYK